MTIEWFALRPVALKNKGGAWRASFFASREGVLIGTPSRLRHYFWMQVSTVSLVHSSRPVNTGSSTFLPLIRSIMTVGAL